MPFTLKEIEKIAPKEKGITFQSVKEILMSLVNDNLVEMDKIGTSQFFWSFPSQAGIKVCRLFVYLFILEMIHSLAPSRVMKKK